MASAHMPRGFNPRGSGRMDSERENFEKTQMTALQKALNNLEAPLKEKHCRRAILGTHQEHGCSVFWSIVLRFPLQGNPVVCWKFCHVLHKILRDGHENCSKDSYRYVGFLNDLALLWGHLKVGLGYLIKYYAQLLVGRLNFHKKYPSIQGNMVLDDGDLEKICNNDINSYFEMCVDMLDYLDHILDLQATVFSSLDMSRANSMTSVGQCRLAPLIPCILDSCQVYDSTVKLLFKLHSSLPPDTLAGHRERFLKQYKELKRFYFNSGNLQYFKNLIKVPVLPDEPPNFLIAADLAIHRKPEAVVEEPEPEPEDAPVDLLVDTAAPQQNGATSPPMPDERDIMIQQLMAEVTRLKEELAQTQAENQMMQESLHNRIRELEQELNELRQIAESTQQENEVLRTALKDGEKNQEAAARLAAMEKIAKTNEEKFKKIKDMYTRIKQEHVDLIRNHAEATKQLNFERKAKEELEHERQSLQQQVTELQHEKSTVEETLNKTSSETAAELMAVNNAKEMLEKEKQSLEEELENLKSEKNQTETKYNEIEETQKATLVQVKNLEEELEKISKIKEETETVYKQEQEQHKEAMQKIQELTSQLDTSKAAEAELSSKLQIITEEMNKFQSKSQDLSEQLASLEQAKTSLAESLKQSQAALDQKQQDLDQSKSDRDLLEQTLKKEIMDYRNSMLVSAVEEAESIIREALAQAENPHITTITCTAEYLMDRATPVLETITQLKNKVESYAQDPQVISEVVKSVSEFSHRLADVIVFGFATSHAAPIEEGEALSAECQSCGDGSLELLTDIKRESYNKVPSAADNVDQLVKRIIAHAETLLPKVEDIKAEQMGDMVDQEMQQTTEAIAQAAEKIASMLAQSHEKYTGIQLQVNEGILDSCNALMRAILKLVEKSKNLQREIVSQGREWGTASAKDFYKRHHRWTEGLISAAKAVGWGANVLVDAADKVVRGEGKFEELMVCSQEIAASTTQLVVASKVKAQRGSENLCQLAEASKGVTECTARVVASAKSGADAIEEIDAMDFSKLTLHQSKRLEMESQVRVIELESCLEKERRKLSELRKTHYKLAGESEGWEQEDCQD